MLLTAARSRISLGLVSQLLQLGVGLLIMPVALVRLDPASLGLWYVFFSLQALVTLLDFGFSQTFSRNFAYVFGGAQQLSKEGFSDLKAGLMNPQLLASTIVAAKKIYSVIASVATFFFFSGGTFYILHIASESGMSQLQVLLSWLIFAASATLNVYFQWQSSLLVGADRVAQNYLIGIFSRLCQLLISVVGLWYFPSLMMLVVAYATSVLVTRILNYFCIRDLLAVDHSSDGSSAQSPNELKILLWHNASKLGLVFLGSFLINRSNTFAIAHYLGLAVSAQHSVAMQMIAVAQGLAQVAFTAYYPKISSARAAGNITKVRNIFFACLGFAWLFYFILIVFALIFGPWALVVIKSKTALPDYSVLIVMSIAALLEMNHSLCATAIVSGNKVPFVSSALISGVAIAIGTIAVGEIGGGLLAFVLVPAIVQMFYNNWKWPLSIFRELNNISDSGHSQREVQNVDN